MKKIKYKIAQFADQHLGYSSGKRFSKEGVNLRVLDGLQAFNEAIDQMIIEKVDVVFIPGDLFHNAHPTVYTVVAAQEGLRRLAAAGIEVHITAGNHDATDVRSEIPSNRQVHEPNNSIFSYIEPYLTKEVLPGLVAHFLSHHAYTDQGETMDLIKLEEGKMNVLLSHGSCYDTNMNAILHSPQEPREVVIPEFIMDLPWDYTFLGHIHERGWIGSTDGKTDTSGRKQFYGGSLVRRGFSDKPCALGRGWTLWEIDEDNVFTPTFFKVKQRPQIDLPKIFAKDVPPADVEEQMVAQLKTIFERYANEDGVIPDDLAPIVRQTLVDVSPASYVAINLTNCSVYSKHFFTYTLKRMDNIKQEKGEQEDEGIVAIDGAAKQDIVEAFDEWMDEEHKESKVIENIKEVESKAKDLLRKGQDDVLEKE